MASSSAQHHDDTKDNGITIFDGGTGREIERRGGPFRQPEWSALALYEDPDIVREVHESYLEAGATAITTNSYALVPFHLGLPRYNADAKRLLKLSVDLAEQARTNYYKKNINDNNNNNKISIIGSIPPMCGSYEPKKFDVEIAKPILTDFLDAYRNRVDILLLETVGSIEEAKCYLSTIFQDFKDNENDWGGTTTTTTTKTTKKLPDVWISFCVSADYGLEQSPHLLTGMSIKDAVAELDREGLLTNISNHASTPTLLVNCCDIRLVAESIDRLVEARHRLSTNSDSSPTDTYKIGAYPNAFSIPPPDAANHTLREVNFNITPGVLQEQCRDWIRRGATVLGGCCGVGPEHIEAMAKLKI